VDAFTCFDVQATETHRKELTVASQETAKWEGEAHGKLHEAHAALSRAHKSLQVQADIASRSKDAALQLQELNLAVSFENAANQERIKRLKLIHDVRPRLCAHTELHALQDSTPSSICSSLCVLLISSYLLAFHVILTRCCSQQSMRTWSRFG
jgi:phosphoenolpyruvate-protein kinase (PTS system EI component)